MSTHRYMAFHTEKLAYTIHSCSSYSAGYLPENILVDKRDDQSSRWSSDSNSPPQFLILKLEQVAIAQTITFGKYEKTHVCNVKQFRIYGGLNTENLTEILEGGLRNDNVSETFRLKHQINDNYFPCEYIKIVPLHSWGPSFNFSIWYVELHGIQDPAVVQPAVSWYNAHVEKEALRLCLKHLRQHNYINAYEALQREADVFLEHPFLTKLHNSLVIEGKYNAAEQVLTEASQDGLFQHYVTLQDYVPKWESIDPVASGDYSLSRPGMRGGHQMVMDSDAEVIYLFGGWDGNQDLADLWFYSMSSREWKLITLNTLAMGGPCARSCHKLCLDEDKKQIFTLGRYLDTSMRTHDNLKSDFFMYDITSGRWTMITDDTAAVGGPQLVFDHQMAIDAEKCTIYVFGGRILQCQSDSGPDRQEPLFSGLFSFLIPNSTWVKIRDDCLQIRSRIGHSMLLHPKERCLYIFGGQRSKEYLNDFLVYNIDARTIYVLYDGSVRDGFVPAAGFTQRATLDPELNEIYVLSGLSKDKDRHSVKNSFWVYSITKNKWSCIYNNENSGREYWAKMQFLEPVPRFAHQLVYDAQKKVHYLFGGNPGKDGQPRMRLDDFWALTLNRPSTSALLRQCVLKLRQHQYMELAQEDPVTALQYLQNQLASVVDHNNEKEVQEFQWLPHKLFSTDSDTNSEGLTRDQQRYQTRTQLYDQLVMFFPSYMTQPRTNLVDLIFVQ